MTAKTIVTVVHLNLLVRALAHHIGGRNALSYRGRLLKKRRRIAVAPY
jgi:hypothetical protein